MAIANLPKLNFSVPFAMTAALPVEYNAYFSSYEDALAAAQTAEAPGSSNTVYYYGQKVVVVGDTSADLYIIQPNQTLKAAGGDGDKEFVFTQSVASATWEIQHDMDKYPAVTVVDTGGNVVVGEVVYNDQNKITITFSAAFSGKAYLN
nr:MAG TPA: hypothetical protein [Caudoviricetes sp.]